MRYLMQPQARDLYQYLRLSKKVEQIAVDNDPWDEQSPPAVSINNVIKEIKDEYNVAKDPFIRLRAAFQLIRLYSYTGQTGELNKAYDNWVGPVNSNSWIKTAALYQKAINAQGPEKNYLLSLVFDRGSYNRVHCLVRFNTRSMDATMKLAHNRHEQNVLLAMKAFNYPGRSLEDIRRIYSSEPDYKELPFLLLREINKVEDWLVTMRVTDFGASATGDNSMEDKKSEDVEVTYRSDQVYAKNLYTFLDGMIAGQKTNNSLLHLYASRLALLNKDRAASERHLVAAARAKDLPLNRRTQLRINRFLLHLEDGFGPKTEEEFMSLINTPLKKLGVYDGDIMKNQLTLYTARKLIRSGDRARGLMLLARTNRALGDLPFGAYKKVYQEMEEQANDADYTAMIAILDKADKSPFEKFLSRKVIASPLDHYGWYTEDDHQRLTRQHLLDYKASWYIRHHRLEEAYAVLKQLPDSFWQGSASAQYIGGDPFVRSVYRSYTVRPEDKSSFNKKQVIGEMIRLEQLARSQPKKAGECYYQLANAWYNMTYFGSDWQIVRQWWSIGELEVFDKNLAWSEFNNDYYGCQQAKKYYDLAVIATKDKKLAVRSFFFSQECLKRRHEYLETIRGGRMTDFKPDFTLLRRKGIRTIDNSDFVQECETYASFVRQYNKKF